MGLSTTTVRSITDDVLFIAKVESGEFNLIFAPVELESVVSLTVKLLGHTATARGVALSVDVDPEVPAILLGVGNRLQQVLTNITSNGKRRVSATSFDGGNGLPLLIRAAIKFVPESTGRVSIRAKVVSTRTRVIDPHEVAAFMGKATVAVDAAAGIGEQALALGLANGQFSRSLTPSMIQSSQCDSARLLEAKHQQGDFLGRLRSAGQRALGSLTQGRTAAVSPASPSHADSGVSEVDEATTTATAASHSCDPRVPFESSSSYLVVDLPTTYVALPTVVMVRFEVEDNGCGISEAHIARLFKPYSQVRQCTL